MLCTVYTLHRPVILNKLIFLLLVNHLLYNKNAYVKFLKCRLPFTEFLWVSLNNGKSKTFYVQQKFITFELSLIVCYKKTRLHFRKELSFCQIY